MRKRVLLAAVFAAGLMSLTGCGLIDKATGGGNQPTPGASAPASAGAKPTPSGTAQAKGDGDNLPDVCALLTKAEVSSLAGGRQIAQVDPDGAAADAATRYCQWQMSGARLAVFLTHSTASEFKQTHGGSDKVSGVGEDAYTDSGHLYVLSDGIQIDVYATLSSGNSEQFAKNTALKVIDKL